MAEQPRSPQTSGTNDFLTAVYFTDQNTGTVVGGFFGTILRTTNGGTTWTQQTSGTSSGLNSVVFTDSITGTVVGNGGTILRTTNGGVSLFLNVSPPDRMVSSLAGTTFFIVTSNADWSVTSDASWCNVTLSGSGNDSILATYTKNSSASPRIANIQIVLPEQPFTFQNVTVSQLGSIGIENITESVFQIYPNPATGFFRIVPDSKNNELIEVIVQDLAGKNILKRQCQDEKEYKFDISTVPQGLYLIFLTFNDHILVRKLIITR